MPAFGLSDWPHWTDAAALVGIGGLAIAFALYRIDGRLAWPARDPYLSESLRYSK
jgi:hypothetical protein